MEQVGWWVSYLAAVIFGLLPGAMNYWSLPTVVLIVPALVVIGIVVGIFIQPPTSR